MSTFISQPHKIIFDTDPGVDDVIALLLLLASPEIHIEAITVCFGNTDVDHGYNNVLKTYDVVRRHCEVYPEDAARFAHLSSPGRTKTTLIKGAAAPLSGKLELAEYFHGDDGLSNIEKTHTDFDVQQPFQSEWLEEGSPNTPAYKHIIDILRREPRGSVTILGVGPMTNIANAFRLDALAMGRAKRIVLMAGAFNVPGNTSAVAEFNVYADPFAAHILLGASSAAMRPLPITVVPLDITTKHEIPFDELVTAVDKLDAPPLERFVSVVLDRPRKVLKLLGYPDAFEMHDPLAAYFSLMHAGVGTGELLHGWTTAKHSFMVERVGEHTRGMLVVDRRMSNEEPGTVRAEDGIVGETAQSGTTHRAVSVDVLTTSPSVDAFRKDLLKRMVWWSPALK